MTAFHLLKFISAQFNLLQVALCTIILVHKLSPLIIHPRAFALNAFHKRFSIKNLFSTANIKINLLHSIRQRVFEEAKRCGELKNKKIIRRISHAHTRKKLVSYWNHVTAINLSAFASKYWIHPYLNGKIKDRKNI